MGKQRGLTLLEMLVALSIMSAVMTLASSAYRYYVLGFNLQQKQLSVQMNQLKINTAWQQQLAATAQYYVPNLDVNLLFYIGKSHELTWMSYRSLQQADLPAVAWMGLEDGQWLYCEATIRQLFVTTKIPESSQICSYFKQVIGPAAQIDFSYFGWKSPAEKYAGISEGSQQVSPFKQEWHPEYFGESTLLLPTYIKLNVTHDGVTNSHWIQIVESDPDKIRIYMGGKDA